MLLAASVNSPAPVLTKLPAPPLPTGSLSVMPCEPPSPGVEDGGAVEGHGGQRGIEDGLEPDAAAVEVQHRIGAQATQGGDADFAAVEVRRAQVAIGRAGQDEQTGIGLCKASAARDSALAMDSEPLLETSKSPLPPAASENCRLVVVVAPV